MTGEIQRLNHNGKKLGIDLTTLKYIAIVAMVLDHTAYFFVSSETGLYAVMRFFERITGPVMFYAAVEGYHHTRSIKKYLLRLGFFALVSYIPFAVAGYTNLVEVDYLYFNVIYTIFMGVIGIHARHRIQNNYLKWIAVAGIGLLCLTSDWGITGYLMMTVFDFYYGDFSKQAFAYILVALLDGGILSQAIYPLTDLVYGEEIHLDRHYFLTGTVKLGLLLPIILLSGYNGERGKGGAFSKWFFYIFYPAHLGVLHLIKMWIEK